MLNLNQPAGLQIFFYRLQSNREMKEKKNTKSKVSSSSLAENALLLPELRGV